MLQRFRSKPSPTTVIACLALFFAVAGGSAIALQGKNSVDSGDIKKNAVKSADIAAKNVKNADIAANAVNGAKIKNSSVGSGDLAAGSVGSAALQDGGVAGVDLTPAEAFHKVGAAGEPAFGNGGDGDCLYSNIPPSTLKLNPSVFYKDPYGMVHLAGIADANDGPGGDANCDEIEDFIAYILPVGYRPQNDMLVENTVSDGDQVLIVGVTDLVSGPDTLPAGSVVDLTDASGVAVDAVSFRAAGTGTGLPRRGAASSGGGGGLPDLGNLLK